MPLGDAALATILSAVIAGLVGYATNRNSAKANNAAAELAAKTAVQNQSVASRTEIETLAFERAKGYYTDTIDRQMAEIHELEGDVRGLKARVHEVEDQVAEKVTEVAELRRLREVDRTEIEKLRRELGLATRLLEQKFPNE